MKSFKKIIKYCVLASIAITSLFVLRERLTEKKQNQDSKMITYVNESEKDNENSSYYEIADDFNKDLIFIKDTLIENHPGICNELDPNFLKDMQQNYKISKEKLLLANSEEEKIEVLQEFGRSFNDSHLGLYYPTNERPTEQIKSFSLQKLNNKSWWINIPTFQLFKNQLQSLNHIIKLLPSLREQTLILDLRGNTGGDSFWGIEILKGIFGDEYVNQRLDELQRDVYVEWRVSEGNLQHIKDLVSRSIEEVGVDNPKIKELQNIYEGMEKCFINNEKLYLEKPNSIFSSSNAKSAFKGRVIVIIDRFCGSASLDFLDGIKAMNSDTILLGETTNADSLYIDVRTIPLPSGKGLLTFPIKVYRNRLRGHNVPYFPDIHYNGDIQNTDELRNYVIENFLKD